MNGYRRGLALLANITAIGILLPACGDLSEFIQPITPAEISGEWHATDLVLTNAADPTQSFDAIDAGGSLFLRFSLDGAFQSIIQTPGQADDVETGTYQILETDEFILVEPTDAPNDTIHFAYEFQKSKTSFSLTLITDDLDYDFDGDGNEVPALLFAIVIR
jgi:hypothetical protein